MHRFHTSIMVLFGLASLLVPASSARAEGVVLPEGLVAIRGARIETVGKAGVIDDGILLLRDGKIEAVGAEVEIPVSARIIEAGGMTIIPGLVDPYYVVSIGRNVQESESRTVVFGGRTFVVGGGSPAVSTNFARVADGIHVPDINWNVARRSGLTTLHLVTGGYAQSVFAQPNAIDATITQPNGKLLTSVSNDTRSLDVLRNGLKEQRPTSSGSSAAAASGGAGGSTASANELWKEVREGKSQVFVNVNNAAAILHTLAAVGEVKQAKVAFIASGPDIFRTLDELDPKAQTVILPPRIDTIPNSQDRVNVPRLLAEKKVTFAFSSSLGQSDYRAQQDTPLFSIGMLVRSGLDPKLALEACTIVPAKLLGLDAEIGTIETGKRANFIILDGDPFDTATGIQHIFIDGESIYEN